MTASLEHVSKTPRHRSHPSARESGRELSPCFSEGCSTVLPALVVAFLLSSSPATAASYDEEETEEAARSERGEGGDAIQAGGLEAPGELSDDDRTSATERELARADREDSGRGLSFAWLDGEFGLDLTDYQLFGGPAGAESVPGGAGFLYGAGVGVRVLYFTLGPRFRGATHDGSSRWSLGGEVGMRLPFGRWEPHADLSLSYVELSATGALPYLSGLEVRPTFGLDYFASSTFSAGLSGSVALFALSGSGEQLVGGGLSFFANVALHF